MGFNSGFKGLKVPIWKFLFSTNFILPQREFAYAITHLLHV